MLAMQPNSVFAPLRSALIHVVHMLAIILRNIYLLGSLRYGFPAISLAFPLYNAPLIVIIHDFTHLFYEVFVKTLPKQPFHDE
jgi:hypothetical protein